MSNPLAEPRELGALLRSVVKIHSVSDAPDYEQPWQTCGAFPSSGSGVVIQTPRGLRTLTNAHCVENQVFIEVRRYGKTKKYVAEVEARSHSCDLALLEVENPEFYAGTEPVDIGGLPELSDRVSVCGYPIGGDRLSVTEGVVSRIEMVQYAQRQRRLLAVQIDAAINSGNSGGPVLKDGKLVGIALQTLDDAETIGYIVPTPVVLHFLTDVERGVDDGFPSLGILSQPLESDAHRRQLRLPETCQDGVLVARVAHGSSAAGVLRVGDVILDIDGITVHADGSVPFRNGEQLTLDYAITRRHVGESVNVRVWRDGGALDCVVRLRDPAQLVVEDRYDVRPSYYVIGGLLLVPLTRDYLKTWGDNWWSRAPRELMALYERGLPTPERIEPVVLQKVLAHTVNQGYHEWESLLIETVQGQPVQSLSHLVAVVEASREEFLRLVTDDGRTLVLDRAEAIASNPEILARYAVPRDRSDDLPPAAGAPG